ncbi:type III pantothenate kinase [Anaerosacchariphilus polymeriproducens]|uniref:Type III pantothenate kinase n=1 Tax=Anaerosacchariphilus polymeriproducens TaxID=1812858 RepID=A0A371AX77_9FIRM|nr:type III pantothenate kinase [Anaerosacchariphilus polymeriproducens]RDU24188.1 type III pantothenate kinase [Anaerosacchariphilus polymeriproducens]
MLLVIDVGNTNITLGVFNKKDLIAKFRVTTKMQRTSDEFGICICDLLEHRNIEVNDIKDIIVASVVPNIMHSLLSGMIKYLNITPIVVEAGIKTGIKLKVENPKQLGADRIVDVVGAKELYGGPIIVVDFGTATTYDMINEADEFIAGVTAPGIRTSAMSLWKEAAKLPEIEIMKPASILAKETITSMQAGLVYGQIGQTEYIIECMKRESGIRNITTVATGGLGAVIAKETKSIDIYNPDLTLQGMRFIYDKQRK